MRTSARITGAGLFLRKIKAHPDLIHRTTESVLLQEARATCVEYGAWTAPGPGFKDASAEKFRTTVEGEVGRVFATVNAPGKIFEMIKLRDPELAKAYWHAYKAKKPRNMAAILRKANLPKGLDPAAHKSVRTGKNGRVIISVPVTVANAAQLRVFVRKQRALVGFAKAGWYCAAKGLGGRVRRNLRDADTGKRSTEEIFPRYVRAIAQKYPNAGGARLLVEGSVIRVEIFTNVRHARNALMQKDLDNINQEAGERLTVALQHAIRHLNQRVFKSVA